MVMRISDFDTWRPGYGGAVVAIYVAGTTTLADIWHDEDMTVAAENPQVLASMLQPDGTRAGKFKEPVYIDDPHFLHIDGVENTGIIRPPFSSLAGESLNGSSITAIGSSFAIDTEKFATLSVNVAMFGDFVDGSGGVAATNTATLNLAIASLPNGGEVIIPPGSYKINSVEVPNGVVIRGSGRESTTLLTILGDVSFNLVGNRAGFRDITLDGNTLMSGSIAVKSVGNNEIVFENVMIRRFETGIHVLGGKGFVWKDFSIENVDYGAKLHGDSDAGDTGNGAALEDVLWMGGIITVAGIHGVSLSYEDQICHNVNFIGVGFELCVGSALRINGAQSIELIGCYFTGNTVNVDIQDDDAPLTPTTEQANDVINVSFIGGRMFQGIFKATGTVENVRMRGTKIDSVNFQMLTPIDNFVILENCYEDGGVVISGETARLLRNVTANNGASFGLTSTNVAAKAWSMRLEPGQVVYLEGKAIARGRNNVNRAIYHIGCGAFRAGGTLAYESQTANFTVGQTLTGMTSGATARIQADSDSGTTGTLTLVDIKGTFLDNEIIVDDGGTPGEAIVNGSLGVSNVALDTVGNINIRTLYETDADYACAFAANGEEIELRVTGDTGQTVEWIVHVEVVTI